MVKDYLCIYAQKLSLPLHFVANRSISVENKPTLFTMTICDISKDAADNYIVDNVHTTDIVITRDIPLADRLVTKNIKVINDRGTLFTTENIKQRLSERNMNLQFEQLGLISHVKNSYTKKEFSAFANCFDREIHRLLHR